MPDSAPGSSLAPASVTTTEVPDDLIHRVTVRIVAGTLSGSSIFEQEVLEQTFEAPEVADRQVFLYFQPELSGIGGGIVRVLTGVETWTPVLLVDGEATMGRPFEAGGRGTDVFGDPTTTSPLTSLRVEVTRSVPGRPDESATHVLLDRVPPALAGSDTLTAEDLAPLASDDAGPLVMGILTQVLVSTGSASGWMQAARRSIAADFMDLLVSDESTAGDHALGDLLYPLAVANASLVLASEQLAIPALGIPGRVRGYVAAPPRVAHDHGPGPHGRGRYGQRYRPAHRRCPGGRRGPGGSGRWCARRHLVRDPRVSVRDGAHPRACRGAQRDSGTAGQHEPGHGPGARRARGARGRDRWRDRAAG